MGREELKWHLLALHKLMSQQGSHFSPCSKAKANYKSTNLRKFVSSGIGDVTFASVYFEKTRLKKLINYFFIARNGGLWRAPEIDFCYETKARRVMVDFKFVALYR